MRLIIDNNDIKIENDSIELDGIDNDKIIEEVLENKDKRLDVNSLQSQYEDTFVDESESIDHLLFKVESEVKTKIDPFLKVDSFWGHILHPQQSTMYHNHKEMHREGISFVYYAKYPKKSGNLIFDFEVLGKRVCYSYEPQVGSLVLFPTWVPHYTSRNVSDDTRISISGNCFPI
jgi:hypothetical protein|tara:strand:+ start:12239 stop:12763 length:525 start_codon:yes stop_codon:yes gene_type:complete